MSDSVGMKQNRLSAPHAMRLHDTLCHQRAFADTPAARATAEAALSELGEKIAGLPARERSKLVDTALPHTALHYRFSWDIACWLASKAPGQVHIDWAGITDEAAFDNLLRHLLLPAEDEYFDSGWASAREWLELARGDAPCTDFDWLIAQLREAGPEEATREKYDATDLPLTWNLGDSLFGRAFNSADLRPDVTGTMAFAGKAKKEICRPLGNARRVSRSEGAHLVDVAMASLATRHRETNHFNHANPNDVHVADVGAGVSVVLFGLQPQWRYPLECTVGHLVLVNGVPVGYGGASALFRQVNTGVNVFREYRGHGAAFLWVQVMRVLHALLGCNRFVANPYQFGADNNEALKSGAFWFYYKLGYRPVEQDVRTLARKEMARRRERPGHRCDIPTLRRLSSCDMHLILPGTRQSDYFKEEWLATSSMLATDIVAGSGSRKRALQQVTGKVVKALRIRSFDEWTRDERNALRSIAPFVCVAEPDDWSTAARREVREALRLKGGQSEMPYARALARNSDFLRDLRRACGRA